MQVEGSEVYNFLLGGGVEHFDNTLGGLGVTGVYTPGADGEQGTVTIRFPGTVLSAFFVDHLDKAGKALDRKKPVPQIHFFGSSFVSKVYHEGDKKVKKMIEDNSTEKLGVMRDKEVAQLTAKWDARISKLEGEIGRHEAQLRRLRRDGTDAAADELLLIERQKGAVAKQLDAEEEIKK